MPGPGQQEVVLMMPHNRDYVGVCVLPLLPSWPPVSGGGEGIVSAPTIILLCGEHIVSTWIV